MTSTPSPGSHPHTDLLRRLDKPGRREKIGHDMAELCKDAAAALRSQIAATDKAEADRDRLAARVETLEGAARALAQAWDRWNEAATWDDTRAAHAELTTAVRALVAPDTPTSPTDTGDDR